MAWGIKRFSNDALRQKFVDISVPQAQTIGLTLPDLELSFNQESGHWDFGAIDWSELWRVIKGDGACNAERIEHRVGAHNEGAWVRQAASAYAAKQTGAKQAGGQQGRARQDEYVA